MIRVTGSDMDYLAVGPQNAGGVAGSVQWEGGLYLPARIMAITLARGDTVSLASMETSRVASRKRQMRKWGS